MDDAEFRGRAEGILQNMALERVGFWRQIWRRWHISDEPLRHDAANLLRQAGVEFALYPKGTQRVGDDQEYLHPSDWPEIPDTPEQRALIKRHNEEIKRQWR